MAVRGWWRPFVKNNTCYLCIEKHGEIGPEHRENAGNLI